MKIIASITVNIMEDESMQVTGPIHDKEWCIKCLEMAKDTVKNFRGNTPIITVPSQYLDKNQLNLLKP